MYFVVGLRASVVFTPLLGTSLTVNVTFSLVIGSHPVSGCPFSCRQLHQTLLMLPVESLIRKRSKYWQSSLRVYYVFLFPLIWAQTVQSVSHWQKSHTQVLLRHQLVSAAPQWSLSQQHASGLSCSWLPLDLIDLKNFLYIYIYLYLTADMLVDKGSCWPYLDMSYCHHIAFSLLAPVWL